MTKIFAESDITIDALEAHIRDSGMVPHEVQPDGIWMRSPQGLGFRISIIEERKFVQFRTFLPLRHDASLEDKRELARRLNEGVFLPVFTVDDDEDLAISYSMPFTAGLIAGNFIAIVHRFASLLEYVVEVFNSDAMIDFSAPTPMPAVGDAGSAPTGGKLLH
ncbi:YbjN domain-containing protein [Ralstonia pseudosolanacearum]|uniref:YbjN domain-containing protein n=1 Tax=Ralstonia pseudosolanacearum TaxID=1310165 RepID=UPI0018C87484|nr:YbjN domain-containing protein [Ralstonia pseudosolanacearum]